MSGSKSAVGLRVGGQAATQPRVLSKTSFREAMAMAFSSGIRPSDVMPASNCMKQRAQLLKR